MCGALRAIVLPHHQHKTLRNKCCIKVYCMNRTTCKHGTQTNKAPKVAGNSTIIAVQCSNMHNHKHFFTLYSYLGCNEQTFFAGVKERQNNETRNTWFRTEHNIYIYNLHKRVRNTTLAVVAKAWKEAVELFTKDNAASRPRMCTVVCIPLCLKLCLKRNCLKLR